MVVATSAVRRAKRGLANSRAMAEQHERHNPVNPKSELMRNKNGPMGQPQTMSGSGATPSAGLSQFRGGAKMNLHMPSHSPQEAHDMGYHLSKHIHELHGAGFWDSFKKGFHSVAHKVRRGFTGLIPGYNELEDAGNAIRDWGEKRKQKARAGMTGEEYYRRNRGGGHHDSDSDDENEAHKMGVHLSNHIHDLHGAGFWSDFGDGFKKGFSSIMSPVLSIGSMLPGQLGMASRLGSAGMSALGMGHSEEQRAAEQMGKKKLGRSRNNGPPLLAGNVDGVVSGGYTSGQYEGHGHCDAPKRMVGAGVRARAEIVKKVMKEHGCSMIEASKYVKAHGLYKK